MQLFLKIFLNLFVLFPIYLQASTYDEYGFQDVAGIYETAVLTNPIVADMHVDAKLRRTAESEHLNILRKKVVGFYADDKFSVKDLQNALQADIESFQQINAALQGFPVGQEGTTFQLKTHKMEVKLQAALDLVGDSDLSDQILRSGLMPTGYHFENPACNIYGDPNHVYASIRGNALKLFLIRAWMLGENKQSLADLKQLLGPNWVDTSPFVHLTPLPSEFDTSPLSDCPYLFSDDQTPKSLMIVHNGYAFGGHRSEPRYQDGKKFGPQDCSSLVALYACDKPAATYHLALHYQMKQGFQFQQIPAYSVEAWDQVVQTWSQDSWRQPIEDSLFPQSITDPAQIEVGMAHAERNFANGPLTGWGGHAGIVLGTIGGQGPDARVLTLSANRDLENTKREFTYGVEHRPILTDEENKRLVMYFRSNRLGAN